MRNLLVHLDSSAQTKGRLELATALAKRMGSRLVGVFAQTQRLVEGGGKSATVSGLPSGPITYFTLGR